jgi:hypothetical protein
VVVEDIEAAMFVCGHELIRSRDGRFEIAAHMPNHRVSARRSSSVSGVSADDAHAT